MKRFFNCLRSVCVIGVACYTATAFAASTDIVVDPFAGSAPATAAVAAPANPSVIENAATIADSPATVNDATPANRAAAPSGTEPRALTAPNLAPEGAKNLKDGGVATKSPDSIRGSVGSLVTDVPWLRALAAFVFVSSLIFMIASIARRMMHGEKRRGGKRNSCLQLRQVLPLGMKRSIYVFDVEGTRLFVGMTGTTMQTLYVQPASAGNAHAEGFSPVGSAPPMAVPSITPSLAAVPGNAGSPVASPFTAAAPQDAVAELRTALLAANDEKPTTATPSVLGEQIRAIVRNLRPFNLRTPMDGRWTK